jgi:hypothetical protein
MDARVQFLLASPNSAFGEVRRVHAQYVGSVKYVIVYHVLSQGMGLKGRGLRPTPNKACWASELLVKSHRPRNTLP